MAAFVATREQGRQAEDAEELESALHDDARDAVGLF